MRNLFLHKVTVEKIAFCSLALNHSRETPENEVISHRAGLGRARAGHERGGVHVAAGGALLEGEAGGLRGGATGRRVVGA